MQVGSRSVFSDGIALFHQQKLAWTLNALCFFGEKLFVAERALRRSFHPFELRRNQELLITSGADHPHRTRHAISFRKRSWACVPVLRP